MGTNFFVIFGGNKWKENLSLGAKIEMKEQKNQTTKRK